MLPPVVKLPPKNTKIVVAYGGGVNTIALILLLWKLGVIPQAIVMANPGHEWKATLRYRDEIMRPWLKAHGFPDVTVVQRWDQGLPPRGTTKWTETLGEECFRVATIPSVAFPPGKKCSIKFKADPQRWWIARQPWAMEEWAAGRKIAKAIGYDTDEDHRIRPDFGDAWEHARMFPWYPVYDAEMDRAACERLILQHLPFLPRKSACVWCPNNTLQDWVDAQNEEPEAFEYAVAMSQRAQNYIEKPEFVGLLRGVRGEAGKQLPTRQLHEAVEIVDGLYRLKQSIARLACSGEEEMPCDCKV